MRGRFYPDFRTDLSRLPFLSGLSNIARKNHKIIYLIFLSLFTSLSICVVIFSFSNPKKHSRDFWLKTLLNLGTLFAKLCFPKNSSKNGYVGASSYSSVT
jgi:hypothetical protein